MTAKYRLRLRFEYGGGCLWGIDPPAQEAFGNPADPYRLPISAKTRQLIERLETRFESSLNWDYPPDPGPWRQPECDRFNSDTLLLFDRLRQELGENFELRNEQVPLQEDPDLDRYLQNPKAFRRKLPA